MLSRWKGRNEGDDEARKIKSIGSRLINRRSVRCRIVTARDMVLELHVEELKLHD